YATLFRSGLQRGPSGGRDAVAGRGHAPLEPLPDGHVAGRLELRHVAGDVPLREPSDALEEAELDLVGLGEDREDGQARRLVDEPVEAEDRPRGGGALGGLLVGSARDGTLAGAAPSAHLAGRAVGGLLAGGIPPLPPHPALPRRAPAALVLTTRSPAGSAGRARASGTRGAGARPGRPAPHRRPAPEAARPAGSCRRRASAPPAPPGTRPRRTRAACA